MSATTVAGPRALGLLALPERLMLGVRLTLALLAAGLLVLALACEALFPEQGALAQLIAGGPRSSSPSRC